MHFLSLVLTSTGHIGPRCFAAAMAAAYGLGLGAQWLTVPEVLSRAGLWPFLLAQALLTWVWFALHAKRLRDAGRGIALAQGIAAIHVLAIALLILVGAFFLDEITVPGTTMPASLTVLRQLLGFVHGLSDPLTILGLIACAALIIPPVFSIWLALQPSRTAGPP
jgi:uncharacterized membrane protein YhaH (DUF805 family)